MTDRAAPNSSPSLVGAIFSAIAIGAIVLTNPEAELSAEPGMRSSMYLAAGDRPTNSLKNCADILAAP